MQLFCNITVFDNGSCNQLGKEGYVKSKRKEKAIATEENIDDEIAAITAAVALILEEEAEREERKPTPFRVVSFKRTNKRRIGD